MKQYYEFVYAQYIESQIYYIHKLLSRLTFKQAQINPEQYFLDSQLLLNLVTNVANVFDSRRKKERSKHLVNFFDISLDKITTITNRDMRNTNEHYDERMDDFMEESNVVLSSKDIEDVRKLVSVIQTRGLTGYADLDNNCLYSVDRNLNRIVIKLSDIKSETNYIMNQINKKRRQVNP